MYHLSKPNGVFLNLFFCILQKAGRSAKRSSQINMAERAREIVHNLLTNSDFIETIAAACDRQDTPGPSNSASFSTSSTVHQTTEAEVRSLFNHGASARPPAPPYYLRHFSRPRRDFR